MVSAFAFVLLSTAYVLLTPGLRRVETILPIGHVCTADLPLTASVLVPSPSARHAPPTANEATTKRTAYRPTTFTPRRRRPAAASRSTPSARSARGRTVSVAGANATNASRGVAGGAAALQPPSVSSTTGLALPQIKPLISHLSPLTSHMGSASSHKTRTAPINITIQYYFYQEQVIRVLSYNSLDQSRSQY